MPDPTPPSECQPPSEEPIVVLTCLYCGREWSFAERSLEAEGVFNVFCPNGECEDRYAATL